MITDSILPLLRHYWPSLLLALLLARLIRNRFHNGLHKYPGPFLASLTDWWRFWDVYRRRPELSHIALHRRYGPVVRLGPNTLSFADPEVLKVVYGLNKGFVKSDFYVVQQAVVKGHSLQSLFSTTDNDFHMQFRRCVNSAFAMSALVQYEPFVDNTTRLFLKQTERLYVGAAGSGGGVACDFTRWLQFYAFDVIGEITYSKRHGFIERNEDVDGIVAYLTKLFLYVAPIGQIPLLDRLFLKNPLYLKLSEWGLLDATFPVAKFARARMAERLPELQDQTETEKRPNSTTTSLPTSEKKLHPVTSPDLLSKFLAARTARPEFMTDTLVQTMAVSMAFAGSETTAISLSAIFYFLLKTPAALFRLRHEIDSAARAGKFSDYETGLVTWHESQNHLPYLDMCVKEAFRLHPAPGLPLERVVPAGGVEIVPGSGERVEGGTVVGCSAWVVHRDERVFGERVEEFWPERWEVREGVEGDEGRVRVMNGTMLQFGMGSRTCIGKNISLLEIYKVVPSLLRRFEIRFDDPNSEWEVVNAWFVKQSNFITRFELRDIVMPDEGVKAEA
ncbi:cytochrome P450-like protein [Chaetomium sp. MPI-SDFR-AT-0129]|nr:cytochrome P450-like protein [Chaetomium sp. MPI-SDFR-AT-0129]